MNMELKPEREGIKMDISASTTHHVPHHFKTADQAFQSSKLGMWGFLVTEVLLFAGLFVAYIIFRNLYPADFHEASKLLDPTKGTINTIVLICSSFTMAMAVNRVQVNKGKQAVVFLLITLLCAGAFMVIKYLEYTHKIHEGILPAGLYKFEGIDLKQFPKVPLYFSIYFLMTGLHGFHVLVGMSLIAWVMVGSMKGKYNEAYHTPVELTGIYWHLVDLIWIYLFPLLYLIG